MFCASILLSSRDPGVKCSFRGDSDRLDMLDPTWVQALGALATGLASGFLALFTWRLYRLESNREKADIRASLGRFERGIKLRLTNKGKQADSVTNVTLTELCPDYEEKKMWDLDVWELRPLGTHTMVGELRPGATVDLHAPKPEGLEPDHRCAYHLDVSMALDEDFRHALGVNSPAGHSEEQELGTSPSID